MTKSKHLNYSDACKIDFIDLVGYKGNHDFWTMSNKKRPQGWEEMTDEVSLGKLVQTAWDASAEKVTNQTKESILKNDGSKLPEYVWLIWKLLYSLNKNYIYLYPLSQVIYSQKTIVGMVNLSSNIATI